MFGQRLVRRKWAAARRCVRAEEAEGAEAGVGVRRWQTPGQCQVGRVKGEQMSASHPELSLRLLQRPEWVVISEVVKAKQRWRWAVQR